MGEGTLKKRDAEKSAQTPKKRPKLKKVGQLVPQPNGRGAIWQGAPANPVAGPGRPANAVKRTMRDHLDMEVLAKLMDDWRRDGENTLDIANFLAKYSLGDKTEMVSDDVKDLLQATINLVMSRRSWDNPNELVDLMEEIWQ